MIRTASTLALTSMLATGAVFAEGPEISFSGYFLSQGFTALDSDYKNPENGVLNEIDLTTSIAFGTATTVDIYTTMDGAKDDNGEGWWPDVVFDGITFTHAFSDDFSFVAGDLIYGAGEFGYYVYKRNYSVIQEDAVRGIGFSSMGLTVYTGQHAMNEWATYVSYEAPTPEGIALSVYGEYEGKPGADAMTGGAVFGFEKDAFALNVTGAGFKSSGSDVGFAILVEPFYDFGAFNVLASFFMEDYGDKPTNEPLYSDDMSDMYVYVEPGFPINDISSFGVTLEYHDPDSDADEDENFQTWPTYYLTPTEDVTLLITAGVTVPLGDKDILEAAGETADPTIGFGFELQGSF